MSTAENMFSRIRELDFAHGIKISGERGKTQSIDGKTGIWKVAMPASFASIINNSSVTTTDFLREFPITHEKAKQEYPQKILGFDFSVNPNERVMSAHSGHMHLSVFHGVANTNIARMSELANSHEKGEELNATERAEYQKLLSELITPVLQKKSDDGNVEVRFVEDCVATGDTIAAILERIKTFKQEYRKNRLSSIRIDVAVATVQGIMAIKTYAEQNGISKVEMNVGNLAFGLSENGYIMYASINEQGLRQKTQSGLIDKLKKITNIMVVGDMGDASKKLAEKYNTTHGWNKYRKDTWQDTGAKAGEDKSLVEHGQMEKLIQEDRNFALFLANGGYLMKAYAEWLDVLDNVEEVVIGAKRVENASAVLIDC